MREQHIFDIDSEMYLILCELAPLNGKQYDTLNVSILTVGTCFCRGTDKSLANGTLKEINTILIFFCLFSCALNCNGSMFNERYQRILETHFKVRLPAMKRRTRCIYSEGSFQDLNTTLTWTASCIPHLRAYLPLVFGEVNRSTAADVAVGSCPVEWPRDRLLRKVLHLICSNGNILLFCIQVTQSGQKQSHSEKHLYF